MRKQSYKGRCKKRSLPKCQGICKTYDAIQSAYADMLQSDDNVIGAFVFTWSRQINISFGNESGDNLVLQYLQSGAQTQLILFFHKTASFYEKDTA